MSKGCLKITLKSHLVELLPFCEVFNFVYKCVKYKHMPNDLKLFTRLAIKDN